MKAISKLFCLALSASLLTGCNVISNIINGGGKSSTSSNSSEGNNSSGNQSSGSSHGGSSSSSGQGGGGGGDSQITAWNAELQSLMQQYCGEVLPIPDNFKANYQFEVYNGYLYVDDYGSSFTIANYYTKLEAAGWSSTLDEQGNHALVDENTGDTFYECYKKSGNSTYTVQYWFDEDYGNEICCDCESQATEKTTDTAWSVEDQEAMLAAFGEVLPFQKFGSDYLWQFSGLYGLLEDTYYQDLCTSYNALLGSNGFTLVTSGSYEGAYQKALAGGNTLYVLAEFTEGTGNAVLVELVPVVNTGWPTDALAEMTSSLGVTVPAPTSGSFSWYTVNGAITATTTTSSEMVSDYYDVLESWNLIVDYTSYMYYSYGLLDYVMAYPWEETVEIDFGDVYAEDGETVESFFVTVNLMTPSSEFSDSWPGTNIEEFLGEGAPEVPAADKVSIKDFKYYLTEDDDGNDIFAIQAYDSGTPGVDAIEDTYKAKFGAGWTIDSSKYDEEGYIVTDANNKVKVQFYSYQGFFSCYIYKLSGGSSGGGGTIPTPTTTKAISPSDFSSSYTSGTKTINGLTMKYTDIMDTNISGTHYIQFKKNSGNLYNETAYDPMVSIRFVNINRTDVITLSAGTSRSSLSAITPIEDGNDLVYVLDGATFFEVTIAGNAVQCTSIVFGF